MTLSEEQALKKRKLRSELRTKRRCFLGEARQRAEAKIVQEVGALISEQSSGFIGLYYPFDGEVDLSLLWGGGLPTSSSSLPALLKQLVFPLHQRGQPLSFIQPTHWSDDRPLPRPQGQSVSLCELSLLMVPGVAFDTVSGLRLGLGGGHYDRTLALYAQHSWPIRAFGVGFNFQLRARLPREPWDLPLDGVVTELGTHMFKRDFTASASRPSLNERETP